MNLRPLKLAFLQSDGSLDEAIILGVIGCLVGIGLQVFDVVHNKATFNAAIFFGGLGGLLSGMGVLMGARGKASPPATPPSA